MALRVTSYRPLVRCSDDPGPLPQACQELIQRMPSTGSSPSAPKIIFGEAGDPDVQVGLPYTITERMSQPHSILFHRIVASHVVDRWGVSLAGGWILIYGLGDG